MLVGKFGIPALDETGLIKDRGDGCCVHLDTSTLLCRIYEIRPKICRVKDSAPKFLPLRLTYWLTERICHLAQWRYR